MTRFSSVLHFRRRLRSVVPKHRYAFFVVSLSSSDNFLWSACYYRGLGCLAEKATRAAMFLSLKEI